MADKKDDKKDTAKAAEPPKAVRIGGESLVDRIVPHIKKIAVMVVLVAVIVSGILVVRWRGEVKKEKATAKLLEVLEVARKEVGPAPTPLPGEPAPKDKADRFATEKDRAEAVLATISSSGAEPIASYKGAMLLAAGKVDDAIAEYKRGQGELGLEGVLCREGLGIALEAKATQEKDATARQKILEESLAAFTAMQPDENGVRRAYALYHQGRLQQTLGKTTEAKALFEKARPLAELAEPTTRDPRTDAQLLPAMIDRRLASM